MLPALLCIFSFVLELNYTEFFMNEIMSLGMKTEVEPSYPVRTHASSFVLVTLNIHL